MNLFSAIKMAKTHRRRSVPWIVALAVVPLLGSCSALHERGAFADPLLLPDEFGSAAVSGDGAWCSDFGDPHLDALITEAFANNLDMMAAWERIEQVDALAVQAGSSRFPTVDAQFTAGRSRTLAPAPIGATTNTQFSFSVPVNYEVDLWGRMRSQRRATVLDGFALAADAESIATTIAAQVAETYFEILQQRELRDLVNDQLDVLRAFQDVIARRFRAGQTTGPDLLIQDQQIRGLEAQLILVAAVEATAEQRLAVLLGRMPSDQVSGTAVRLPDAAGGVDVGVPADLLDQRPDVRAARFRLEAADERVAVAVADRLPSIRLSASVGFQATSLGDLLDQVLWSVLGAITQPIFGGDRRNAEVQRTESVLDEQLYNYGSTLLTAMLEVENALTYESFQRDYIAALAEQTAVASESLEVEQERYRLGGSDYLRVLNAVSSLQQTEQNLLQSRRQLLSYRVQLCRAIGGDFTRELEAPTSTDEDE